MRRARDEGNTTTKEEVEEEVAEEGDRKESAEQAMRRMLGQLRRAMSENAEMRCLHADEAEKFMDSELALDDAVRALEGAADSGASAGCCAALGGVDALQELLVHENEDVVADAVTVLSEMSDTSAVEESAAELDGRARFAAAAVRSAKCVPRLAAVAAGATTEDATVYAVLSCIEHLCEACPAELCARLLQQQQQGQQQQDAPVPFLELLARRIGAAAKRCSTAEDDVGKYAAELAAVLASCDSGSDAMRNALGCACMEPLLHAASAVRAWSPVCAEDIEFVENLFDVIASMLATPDNQTRFDDLEGSALLLIIIKAKSLAQKGALRALDLALQNNKRGCTLFVEFLGLKTLFHILMKGPCKHAAAKSKSDIRDFYGLQMPPSHLCSTPSHHREFAHWMMTTRKRVVMRLIAVPELGCG